MADGGIEEDMVDKLGKRIREEEKAQIKYTIKDTRILHEKFKTEKIMESHANPLYYKRD